MNTPGAQGGNRGQVEEGTMSDELKETADLRGCPHETCQWRPRWGPGDERDILTVHQTIKQEIADPLFRHPRMDYI